MLFKERIYLSFVDIFLIEFRIRDIADHRERDARSRYSYIGFRPGHSLQSLSLFLSFPDPKPNSIRLIDPSQKKQPQDFTW